METPECFVLVCDENPKKCEQCAKNYWLDEPNNVCIDATC